MILLVRWECIIFVASIHTQSWKRATASGNGDEHAADYITQKYTHTQRMWWWVIGAMMPAFDAEQCRLWPVCASHNELNHYISVFTLPNPAASSLFLIKSFSDQTSSFLTLWPFLLYYFVAIVAVCVCVWQQKRSQMHAHKSSYSITRRAFIVLGHVQVHAMSGPDWATEMNMHQWAFSHNRHQMRWTISFFV